MSESNGTSAFDPGRHLTKISGKDYLEVKWRLAWLRAEHPDAIIRTECLHFSPDDAHFKATIMLPSGAEASGHGSEEGSDFGDFYEKAETKAVGRACAALGYGTQFCDDFAFGAEQGRVVDAPVSRQPQQRQQSAPRQQQGNGQSQVGQTNQQLTERQRNFIFAILSGKGVGDQDKETMYKALVTKMGGPDATEFTRAQASKAIEFIQGDEWEAFAHSTAKAPF